MQQNLAFAHQHLWCKPYLLPLIFLFVWTPRALVLLLPTSPYYQCVWNTTNVGASLI